MVLALLGCAEQGTPEAQIELSWTGADTGRLVASGSAAWCERDKRLELMAARGDSGVGMAIYPSDSLVVGEYALLPATDSLSRPSAAIGVRWIKGNAIVGYRSYRGQLTLERVSDSMISGRLNAELTPPERPSDLDLEGKFTNVVLHPAIRGCGSDSIGVGGDSM